LFSANAAAYWPRPNSASHCAKSMSVPELSNDSSVRIIPQPHWIKAIQ
jgi:hypothetical protein